MSHELRTPLNSLLILAEMLAGNPDGNLTPKQEEFAKTIHSSGFDLLTLINDILDMAKIESGTMPVDVDEMAFADLQDYVERTFQPVAHNKDLPFTIELADNLPAVMQTDAKRLQQVLRNLLSNAFKFTEEGKVSLRVELARKGWSADHPVLGRADAVVAFAVSDTGIGIPADKLKIIFEPFQQADSGTSRRYGGTGLGLSISREIGRFLGGEIRVRSITGEGSTFTLYLPLSYRSAATGDLAAVPERSEARAARRPTVPPPAGQPEVGGDHGLIRPGDAVLLIVERDPTFAQILLQTAHEQGLKALIVPRGEMALTLAREVQPVAITLDLCLPDLHGFKVLQRLKDDPRTRHIPVHIISGDEGGLRSQEAGAVACLKKPVSRKDLVEAFAKMKGVVDCPLKNLLVVEDNDIERDHVVKMVAERGVRTTAVGSGAEALTALKTQRFDCLVLDLRLPDVQGLELVETIKKELNLHDLPIIIYTGKELTAEEDTRLRELTARIISKDARSLDRLREETAPFLHRVVAERSRDETGSVPPRLAAERAAPSLKAPPNSGAEAGRLAGKTILVVDDDVRNLFALMSMLERFQAQVLRAESGQEALESLEHHPEVDAVLMDIMMPGMDGYETTRTIRRQQRFRSLPIIALTAKAMKGDREKCLEAGASDYLAKPVGSEQLLTHLCAQLSVHEAAAAVP
jgi:CheY-like chemotaxis protein/two-component sensor histidine kinase